MPTTAR